LIKREIKSRLKNKYGLTPEQYNQMLEDQNHSCLIC
jgi:predicted transcriptional regulator